MFFSDRLERAELTVALQNQHLLREILRLVERIAHQTPNRILGGVMSQLGDPMNPIQPGQSLKFQVTPTFSGEAFALDPAKTAVVSSDPTNFPAVLDSADPSIINVDIPKDAQPTGGSEAITVTWTYTNTDGTTATVTGSVTELGIVDDVTGGTFAQIQ
jgi:hypothetical protein